MKAPIALLLALAAPASAALTPAELAAVGATPAAGAMLPVGRYLDQAGQPFTLGPEALPTVLLFADYSCRHLCGAGVTLTAGALHDAGLVAGRDYRMVVIGMDGDGPRRARALIAERLRGLSAEAAAMRLLSGPPATIAVAERMLGYHAAYDASADQFAHDAAIYVFSPAGRLSALLPETATTAADLAAAVTGARSGVAYHPPAPATPGLAARVVAICYGLAAASGTWEAAAILALRVAAVAMIAAGIALLLRARRRAAA
jgi:protein SCO1/2